MKDGNNDDGADNRHTIYERPSLGSLTSLGGALFPFFFCTTRLAHTDCQAELILQAKCAHLKWLEMQSMRHVLVLRTRNSGLARRSLV